MSTAKTTLVTGPRVQTSQQWVHYHAYTSSY